MERAAHDLSNAVRIGHVVELDAPRARCRVESGDITTGWIPWLASVAGDARAWCVPAIGEQVLLLCPEGDPTGAVALRGLYSADFAAPESEATTVAIHFADGAVLRYSLASHALEATLPDGGTAVVTASGSVTVNCEGGVTINGPVTINGDLSVAGDADVSGTATAEVDVVGGGKSLKDHRHLGVTSGGAVSGPPQ